jgi:hypothetical protein
MLLLMMTSAMFLLNVLQAYRLESIAQTTSNPAWWNGKSMPPQPENKEMSRGFFVQAIGWRRSINIGVQS